MRAVLYVAVPALVALLGGAIAAKWPPGRRVSSAVQHLTAGIIFGAVAVEVLPEAHHQRPAAVITGFVLGTLAMLAVKHVTERLEQRSGQESASGLVTALGIDLFIDGLLLGVAYVTGANTGFVLAFALSLEALFLNLSAGAAVQDAGGRPRQVLLTSFRLAALLAAGATFGVLVFDALPTAVFGAVLGFGSAALLYSVTEELLVEAHEGPENALITSMFFAGFVLVMLMEA